MKNQDIGELRESFTCIFSLQRELCACCSEGEVLERLCVGLKALPGVSSVRYVKGRVDAAPTEEGKVVSFSLGASEEEFGVVHVVSSNPDAFAPFFDAVEASVKVAGVVFQRLRQEREHAEALVRQNRQHLEEKVQALGRMAGGVAHDFNNLLGGIFGYIELARELCPADSLEASYLDSAQAVLARARNLTQQLLTFSKGGSPRRRPAAIQRVLRAGASSVLAGSTAQCTFEIEDGLWMGDCDPKQIEQVVQNLVQNSLNAISENGRIWIRAKNTSLEEGRSELEAGRYVQVEVEDNGEGIAPEYIQRIFDPFFSTKERGYGLGLATSFSIIKRHGGSVEVESQPGQGSIFRFFLPAAEEVSSQPLPPKPTKHQGSGKILVMDDEVFIRDIFKRTLTRMGYEVLTAEDGRQALSLFQSLADKGESFAAIFLDLSVPGGMGGLETFQALVEQGNTAPCFACSGYSADDIIANPQRYGFTDSLCKPFTRGELTDLLLRHLSQRTS